MTLAVVRRPTPSGSDTLEVGGLLLHSKYDPRKEVSRLAADAAGASHVIILSPGLGYLADALAGRELLLVERHAAIAAHDARRERLIDPDPAEVRDRVLDWKGLESGKLAVLSGVILPGDEEYYEAVRAAAIRAMEQRAEEVATIRGFSATWEANLAGNRAWIAAANRHAATSSSGPPSGTRPDGDDRAAGAVWLDPARLGWKGRTVALLAAGPSLRDDLPVLAEACERGGSSRPPVVVAVDSALPAVLSAGIVPDAVVTLDPQPVKASCLEALGGIPLIASVLSPPAVLARARRLFLFGQGHPAEAAAGVPASAVQGDIGGSVATAAVALAVTAGAETLLLIGQDLSIDTTRGPGAATHVGGTHFERRLLGLLGRFTGGARAILRIMAPTNLRHVPAVDGGMVATTPVLDGYRTWIREFAARRPDVVFVQTSRRGAAIGIPARPLAEALTLARCPVDRTDNA